MRANPGLDVATAITELGVGEALVSLLDDKGRPSITQRVFIVPPGSQLGPITPAQRQALMQGSLVAGVYEKAIDRESAFEKLTGRAAASAAGAAGAATTGVPQPATGPNTDTTSPGEAGSSGAAGGLLGGLSELLFGSTGPRGGRHEGLAQTAARSAMRSVGSAVGREIVRGVLGSLLGGGRRR
jgi:hypothetical protein